MSQVPEGGSDLWEEIARIRRLGRRAALATIIRRVGSTPRKDHAKMLIREDGSTLGSVGGGCVEAEVWQLAQKVIRDRKAELLRYQLTDDEVLEEGLICGGTVEVFVEAILPDPELIVLGAGHLGQAIAAAAHPLGFRVTVVDDREQFANSQRFPSAQRLIVQPFELRLDDLGVTSESFILIVTRGHKHDQAALESAVRTPARYVGLVGSRRKIKLLVTNLLGQGFQPEHFQNLYAPIGLDIGSETPEEIAVSVMAELIALQKNHHCRSEKQEFIMRVLEEASESEASSLEAPEVT